MQEAREIYQGYLDTVSRALWDGMFDVVAAHHVYPFTMRNPDADISFSSADDCIAEVRRLRTRLDGLGATAYHRVCDTAAWDPNDSDRIVGTHWTYIMRGGNYLSEPYNAAMTIVRQALHWRATDIRTPPMKHGIPTPVPDEGISQGRGR